MAHTHPAWLHSLVPKSLRGEGLSREDKARQLLQFDTTNNLKSLGTSLMDMVRPDPSLNVQALSNELRQIDI